MSNFDLFDDHPVRRTQKEPATPENTFRRKFELKTTESVESLSSKPRKKAGKGSLAKKSPSKGFLNSFSD